MVEEITGHKQIIAAIRLEQRRRQPRLLHRLAHHPDAAALRFGKPRLVQHCRHARVARLTARLPQMLRRLERETRVANLQPVGVANDLHRAVAAVAAVHQRVHQRLTDDTLRDHRFVLALQVALVQSKALGQIVQHSGLGAADQAKQRIAQLNGVEPTIRVRHPFTARHADVIHPRHGETAAQGQGVAKQHQPRHRGPPAPLRILADAAQRTQQILVRPAQLFGIRVGGGAGLAVVGQGCGCQIVQRGIRHQTGIKTLALTPLVEHRQIVIGAMLIHTAHTAQRPFGQALGLEENRLVLRRRLGDEGHHHGSPLHLLGAQLHAHRHIEALAALRGQGGAQLVGLRHALHLVAGEQRHLFPHHPQHQPAPTQTGFIGKRTHRFQQRLPGLAGPLGLDALGFVQQVQALQQLQRRHAGRPWAVTSASRRRISASAFFKSASISASGRGGVKV